MEELKSRLDFYMKGRMAELNTHLLVRLIEPNIPEIYRKDRAYEEIFEGAKLVQRYLKRWSERGEAAWRNVPTHDDLMHYACDMRNAGWHGRYPDPAESIWGTPYGTLFEITPILYISVAYAWMLSCRNTLSNILQQYMDRMHEENWKYQITYLRCIETAEMVVEDIKEVSAQYTEVIADDDYSGIDVMWTEEDYEEMIKYQAWEQEAITNYDTCKEENKKLKETIEKLKAEDDKGGELDENGNYPQFTNRQQVILFQTILNVTLEAEVGEEAVNKKAFSDFLGYVSGHSGGSIRSTVNAGINYDKKGVKDDVRFIAEKMKGINEGMSQRLLAQIGEEKSVVTTKKRKIKK